MKIGIVGAGAMGSFFGGHLKRGGHDVTLIDTWQDHIDAINAHGLEICKDGETMQIMIPACRPDAVQDTKDLILVMVKSFHTEVALQGVRGLIGPDTVIMTLQNGIGHTEKISEFTRSANIIHGITTYPADLEGPGHVSSTGQGTIKMMTADGKDRPMLGEVRQAFADGGLECEIAPDVSVAIWEKLAFNAAMNGLTSILNINVGQLGDTDMGRDLSKAIVAEVAGVALKKQIPVQQKRILSTMDMAFREHREHLPSMYKDIKSQKPTEVEAIHGAAVRAGKESGMSLPVCETVYRMVRIISGKYNIS